MQTHLQPIPVRCIAQNPSEPRVYLQRAIEPKEGGFEPFASRRRTTGLCGLCGKTRKMTGRENLDFARRTSSARVIVTMRRMEGPHAARSPARPNPCRIYLQGRYGRLNCDRREKSSFSTQSAHLRQFERRLESTFSRHRRPPPWTGQLGGFLPSQSAHGNCWSRR